MEELRARLEAIRVEMDELQEVTNIINKEAKILSFFDKVHKEVI